MSTLVENSGTAAPANIATGSIDSSSSFVEIDSENTSSSHEPMDEEELDTKPNITPYSEQFLKANFSAMGGISIPHHGLSAAFHGYHHHHHQHHSHHHHHMNNHSYANNNNNNSNNNNNNSSSGGSSSKTPFMLPAQLYKSLFASAVLQNPDKITAPPFPRNLLFSCSEKSPNSSDAEVDEKSSLAEEVY